LPKATHELAASLKPFSIAGIKFDGITCPTIMLSNSNLVIDPCGIGSMYLYMEKYSKAIPGITFIKLVLQLKLII
jgi:hypothetical protein